ncbi:SpoIIE family protein phosphatase [Streptomyces palmae]|uniref:protein-serine/threonine phosphatase n=1 Tax=Streptomyces palmae TaxID=1701085 RepID=A0A4Z0GW59_9ACTN|nr:SpoIIE family protein phosphatase [Streptomyces palmae]TGB00975.1 PAS domain S-box protein [Streptomyces palmae]
MGSTEAFPAGSAPTEANSAEPGDLLDLLGVAAVMLDARGRIALWSPQAQELFGWTAQEALGEYAAKLLVAPEHRELVLGIFAEVMGGGEHWAGVFPVLHKDGTTRRVEFRNMRLLDASGAGYALGIAADQSVLREVEQDLALSVRLVAQSPIGLAVYDERLRYVMVNPALARMNGLPAEEHIGRSVHEVLDFLDTEELSATMRKVLATGVPMLNQFTVGRPPDDPGVEHAWSASHYRLEDSSGRVLGLSTSLIDVTEQHQAALAAARARRRLTVIADASVSIGTTLDVDRTAQELADVVVPELADLAAVDVLDAILEGGHRSAAPAAGSARFRALAVSSAYPTEAVEAADPTGQIAAYADDRVVTQCVVTGRPVLVERVTAEDLRLIAASPRAAELLTRSGLHSYMAVPLIARGEVLGALTLGRARHPVPFDEEDLLLAGELAARAAVCIDNARWYQSERRTALALQRHLLTHRPPRPRGLDIAYRYEPAHAAGRVGGDWFDVISLPGDRTALVVGDVMGSGINAAATMGQLRTATRTLAELDLGPAEVLRHLDRTATDLDPALATCIYALYDARRARCVVSVAGHLPPVLVRPGRRPELLQLPTGAPLGVGGVHFEETAVPLSAGEELVLYTDGLVETRDQPIHLRLERLAELLAGPHEDLEALCDQLLAALRNPDEHDDVALLISRATALDS